jgi:hypothetical protein
VNVQDRIARLQALLARVTERAQAPRQANGESALAPEEPATAFAPIDTQALDEPDISVEVASPPPPDVEPLTDEEIVEDVEVVAAETTMIEVEAPPAHEEAHSRERMIAASPAPGLEIEEKEVESSAHTEVTVSHSHPVEAAEVEDVEEPPASSRRPIALEPKLEELAFGDAPPPGVTHTPPPESGRQMAVAPGDLEFEGELTGVRPKEPDAAATTGERTVASPELTIARAAEGAAAMFKGEAPVFKPLSFGELLDATLSL